MGVAEIKPTHVVYGWLCISKGWQHKGILYKRNSNSLILLPMEVGNLYWFQSVALKVCSKTLLWGVSDCLFLSPDWCILLMCPLVSNWTKTKLPHATTVFGGFIKTSWNQWFDWCWCCHRDWIGSNTMHTTSCIHSASSIVAVDCNIVGAFSAGWSM